MTNYIKEYIQEMIGNTAFSQGHFEILARELDRLDPRDFEPNIQSRLLWLRSRMHYVLQARTRDPKPTIEYLQSLLPVLDQYRGDYSRAIQRSFAYLSDAELKGIVERDYAELVIKLFPAGAWKSTVIIAGSILEAILHDVLSDANRVTQTNASSKGAKGKGGVPIDITVDPDAWKLVHLIDVAVDIGVLPADRAATIDQVLRDYRNFVHPRKEIKAKHECSEAEAGLAKYGLEGVCDHLEKTL